MSLIRFGVTATPSYDQFETVTITASIRQGDCQGAAVMHCDMPVDEAEKFAHEILRWCKIVREDQG